jgi:hypothetical protein
MAPKKMSQKSKLLLKLEEVPIVEEEEAQKPESDEGYESDKKEKKIENENADPTGLYCHSCKIKTADVDLKESSCKGRTANSVERRTLSATCKTCNKKKHSFAKKL